MYSVSSPSPTDSSSLRGDLVEDELRRERLPGLRLELVAVPGVAVAVLEVALDLGRDQALRQRHLDLGEQRLERVVARLDTLLQLLVAGQPGPQVGLQLVQGVELAGQLREVVVERGQVADLHRADRHRDVDGVSGTRRRAAGR
jgi:hypothetical protein